MLLINIFKGKIKPKHILEFRQNLANKLEIEFPQIKKALALCSNIHISSSNASNEIVILRSYGEKEHEQLKRDHRSHFTMNGVLIFNRRTKQYEPIRLKFFADSLVTIWVDKPLYFHRRFDLSKIETKQILIENLPIEYHDQKYAIKALKSLNEKQLDLLDLEYSFEIDYEGKSYYTILDMEDGNYIAVDKKGKIYRLNHDHDTRVKLLTTNPTDFFKLYNGKKKDLENIMYD